MQVLSNDRLLRRESRIGGILLSVTFALLMLGLLLSLAAEGWVHLLEPLMPEAGGWLPIAVTYAIVLVGMALYYLGNARVKRYGPQYRQDGRLSRLLDGLDDRYVLYTFLGKMLPDYVLVGPSGIFVIIARGQRGEVFCRDDRWSIRSGAARRFFTAMYGSPIGSPSFDANQGVQQLQALLARELPDLAAAIPVSGLIVFTADDVKLRIERCSFPATTSRQLRKVVTKLKGRLNATQLATTRAVFERARTS